jgi:hypothetical protein
MDRQVSGRPTPSPAIRSSINTRSGTNLKDKTFNGHICRLAEGSYGGFFGWPN